MTRPTPKTCTARHSDPYAECERLFAHEGWHRAETSAPVTRTDAHGLTYPEAQIISWAPD